MASRPVHDPESYNRIFILGAKSYSEDEIKEAFNKYGDVKDVYFVKDKHTHERKDIAYVTYSKASEAALAIEETNGKTLNSSNYKSVKVILANSRNEGNVREANEDLKMLRLFIVVPKSFTEGDIREDFSKYGTIESIYFVKDKNTGKRRDLAYVKFHRAYHAALALEGCDAHYKPVFAAAPGSRGRDGGGSDGLRCRSGSLDWAVSRYDNYYDQSQPLTHAARDFPPAPSALGSSGFGRNVGGGETTIEVMLPTVISYDQANKLFDLMPQLDYCNFDQSTGLACAKYTTATAAAYAKEKLDGFEYPPGYRLSVRYYRPRYDMYAGQDSISSAMQCLRQGVASAAEDPVGIRALVDTIQKFP